MLTSVVLYVASPSIPTVNPSGYGEAVLNSLGPSFLAVAPYAAAVTAFGIGVSFIVGWVGRRKATKLDSASSSEYLWDNRRGVAVSRRSVETRYLNSDNADERARMRRRYSDL